MAVGGFDGRPWKVLSHHEFAFEPDPILSADRRWLVYGGETRDFKKSLLWLLNTRTQKETKVLEGPAFGWSVPAFSPSSDTLAVYSSYDSRWPTVTGMGLYLVDTASGQSRYLGYPRQSAIEATMQIGLVGWSANGTRLLLQLLSRAKNQQVREFYAFDVGPDRFRRIEGRYDRETHTTHFIDGGVEVKTHDTTDWIWRDLKSPDGLRVASIDDDHVLWVTTKGMPRLRVDAGHYDDCEGVTIRIDGWLEGSRYLLYTEGEHFYIYEPDTRTRGRVFKTYSVGRLVW